MRSLRLKKLMTIGALALLASPPLARQAAAASQNGSFAVNVTLSAGCVVASTSPVSFTVSTGILNVATTANGAVSIECTPSSPYNIQLNQGTATGATVTTRKMTGPASATINYGLYQNSGLSTNWGQTNGTDTVAGTGNGNAQTYTVYGQIPVQTTPAAGTYTDTITVTVSF
jgi:spore coat protein U-like protein